VESGIPYSNISVVLKALRSIDFNVSENTTFDISCEVSDLFNRSLSGKWRIYSSSIELTSSPKTFNVCNITIPEAASVGTYKVKVTMSNSTLGITKTGEAYFYVFKVGYIKLTLRK